MPAFAVIPADKEHDTIVAFKASVVEVSDLVVDLMSLLIIAGVMPRFCE